MRHTCQSNRVSGTSRPAIHPGKALTRAPAGVRPQPPWTPTGIREATLRRLSRPVTGRECRRWTGPPAHRIHRWPSNSPTGRCGCRSSGTPVAQAAALIPTNGSRSVWKETKPAKRQPPRSPCAPPAWSAPSAWCCRSGTGISASTVSGAAWSPPNARHCRTARDRAPQVPGAHRLLMARIPR
jgi:hypothetical protein